MDSIALISDIHGNMPALDVVLRDIRARGVTRIFCLGDLVGKGPESAAAVDICREVCQKTIIGNWDAMVANENEVPTSGPPDVVEILNWHRRQLGTERLLYLKRLPGVIDLVLSGKNVRLFHASQRGIRYRVHYRDPVDKHLAMFENTDFTGYDTNPDVVGYADIHYAFKAFYGERMLFNVGSVGNPLDRTLACYVLLTGEYEGDGATALSADIIRLPYDIDESLRRAAESGMPEYDLYEMELRSARYRGSPPASPAAH